MKKFIMLAIVIFSLPLLFGIRSLPSKAICFSTISCTSFEGMDYNYISYPLSNGERINSNDIDPLGKDFRSINKWDAEQQAWRSSSYSPFLEFGWINTFPIEQGISYLISSLQHDFKFITTGRVYGINPYILLAPKKDVGNNFIMHPIDKVDLSNASDIGNDIAVCNQVSKWDATIQNWNSCDYNVGEDIWTNDFISKIGNPVVVSVTEDVTWPSIILKDFTKINSKTVLSINYPKVVYYRVINALKKDYDLNAKKDKIKFKAWIDGREKDILTEKSFDCGFVSINDTLSTVYFNIGNFENQWLPDDVIVIEVKVKGDNDPNIISKGDGDYTLKKNADPVFIGFEEYIKGSGEPIIVEDITSIGSNMPLTTELYQNYPNPFNPTTTIRFSLKDENKVNLKIYNYSGQLVKALINETREKGLHKIEFDASQFSSGVYYYTLRTDTKTFTKKMLMIK